MRLLFITAHFKDMHDESSSSTIPNSLPYGLFEQLQREYFKHLSNNEAFFADKACSGPAKKIKDSRTIQYEGNVIYWVI
jgi:hypothetical protein